MGPLKVTAKLLVREVHMSGFAWVITENSDFFSLSKNELVMLVDDKGVEYEPVWIYASKNAPRPNKYINSLYAIAQFKVLGAYADGRVNVKPSRCCSSITLNSSEVVSLKDRKGRVLSPCLSQVQSLEASKGRA